MARTIMARLALQNRTLEGGEIDLLRQLSMMAEDRRPGDGRTDEAILADEIQHVRFANQWLRRLGEENPRNLLDVITAMRFLKSVTEAMRRRWARRMRMGVDLISYNDVATPPSIEDRRLREFSEEEIVALLNRKASANSRRGTSPTGRVAEPGRRRCRAASAARVAAGTEGALR